MANDTIKGSGDVYEKDLYGDLRTSGKSVIPVLEAINDILIKQSKSSESILNISPKDMKSLDELNKGLEETNDIFKAKIKIDKQVAIQQERFNKQNEQQTKSLGQLQKQVDDLRKQRAALNKEEKLEGANLDEISQKRAQLNVELQIANQNLRNAQKEVIGLTDANEKLEDEYDRQSKRLVALRKRYKSLVLIEGAATAETRKLLREIQKLDKELKDADESVGQFGRNVGDYPDSANKATKALVALAAAVGTLKVGLDAVDTSLRSTAEGSEDLQEATSAVDEVIGLASNTAGSFFLDVLDLGKGVIDGNTESLNALGKSLITLTGNTVLADLAFKDTDLEETFSRTAEATDNFGEKLDDAIESGREFARRQIELRKQLRLYEQQIATLNAEIVKQTAISGDSTRSFDEIEQAVIKLGKAQESVAAINVKIAKEELAIIRVRLDQRRKLGREVEDLLDEEAAALVNLQNTRNELLAEQLENEKILRENARDRFERELDFAIDAFDSQKTVNERRIADEKKNLDERRKIFDETVALTDKSFQNQIKLVQDFTGQKIDLDALSRESDEESIRATLRKFNFDDVTLGRILEIIKERKLALQDLTDAQRDLTDVEQDAIDRRKDIIAQEEALGKITTESIEQSNLAFENLEKDREQQNIDNLRRRLFLAEEGSSQFLEIQQELNDALLDQQRDRIDKEIEQEEKAAEQKEAISKALLDGLEKGLIASSQRRVEQLDKEISESEKQQDRLREIADRGVLDADQSLAAEEKKQAELERERQEEEIKQERLAAAFKIVSAAIEAGSTPQQAVLEAGVLLEALPPIINSLPVFWEGTKTTVADSLGKPHLNTNRDGYVVRVDGKEKILNPGQSARTGNLTTEEITRAAELYDKKMLNDLHVHNQPKTDTIIDTNWMNNMQILSKFESLESSVVKTNTEIKKAIEDKQVLDDVIYDKVLDTITTVMRSKNKTTRTTSKVKRLS